MSSPNPVSIEDTSKAVHTAVTRFLRDHEGPEGTSMTDGYQLIGMLDHHKAWLLKEMIRNDEDNIDARRKGKCDEKKETR